MSRCTPPWPHHICTHNFVITERWRLALVAGSTRFRSATLLHAPRNQGLDPLSGAPEPKSQSEPSELVGSTLFTEAGCTDADTLERGVAVRG